MAKKLFNLPASLEDIPRAIGTKDFFVNTDFLSTVALNLLRKWGFVPSFGLDYFDDIPIGISTLGLPVFDNIEFLGGQYSVINANTLQQIIPYNGLKIDTVIVEASQRKNIIKTTINVTLFDINTIAIVQDEISFWKRYGEKGGNNYCRN